MDPRSGEIGLSLNLRALAWARLPTKSFVDITSSHVGELSLPERDHPSPKGEVPRLGYDCSNKPLAPMSSRLSEPLSSKQDSTSLKTRALHLSESSSMNLGVFLLVFPKRDKLGWVKTSDLAIVLPATTIHSYPNNNTRHSIHQQ